jgi:hypothetical protein
MVDQRMAARHQSSECPYVAAADEPFERRCETSGEPSEQHAAAEEEEQEALHDGLGVALEDMEDRPVAERRAAQRKADEASLGTELDVREDAFADDEASSVLQVVEACSILVPSEQLPDFCTDIDVAVVLHTP